MTLKIGDTAPDFEAEMNHPSNPTPGNPGHIRASGNSRGDSMRKYPPFCRGGGPLVYALGAQRWGDLGHARGRP